MKHTLRLAAALAATWVATTFADSAYPPPDGPYVPVDAPQRAQPTPYQPPRAEPTERAQRPREQPDLQSDLRMPPRPEPGNGTAPRYTAEPVPDDGRQYRQAPPETGDRATATTRWRPGPEPSSGQPRFDPGSYRAADFDNRRASPRTDPFDPGARVPPERPYETRQAEPSEEAFRAEERRGAVAAPYPAPRPYEQAGPFQVPEPPGLQRAWQGRRPWGRPLPRYSSTQQNARQHRWDEPFGRIPQPAPTDYGFRRRPSSTARAPSRNFADEYPTRGDPPAPQGSPAFGLQETPLSGIYDQFPPPSNGTAERSWSVPNRQDSLGAYPPATGVFETPSDSRGEFGRLRSGHGDAPLYRERTDTSYGQSGGATRPPSRRY